MYLVTSTLTLASYTTWARAITNPPKIAKRQETAASQESKKPLIYNSTGAERRPGLSAIAQLTVGAVELDDDSTPHRLIKQYLADKKEFLAYSSIAQFSPER